MRVGVLVLALMTIVADVQGQVTKHSFGKAPDGTAVDLYTIKSGALEAKITNYGGLVTSLKVPDRHGKIADVVLGYDSLDGYLTKSPFFGALVGRYGNRIGGAKFVLDGKTYSTPRNDGANTLHGGTKGFDKVVWKAKEIPHGIELTYVSPDGDQGFPGTLTTLVRYTLLGKDFKIEYSATTDKDTVVNLTHHSYFNLKGQGEGDILQHQLKLNASRYTPLDATTGCSTVAGANCPRRRKFMSRLRAASCRSGPTSPACSFTREISWTAPLRARVGRFTGIAQDSAWKRSTFPIRRTIRSFHQPS